MKSLKLATLYGFLLWLIPFAVAVALFPLKEGGSPLFETIMPVVVVTTAVFLINFYFVDAESGFVGEGLRVGLLWMLMSILLDLGMFTWGPMQMSLSAYMADIGLAYVMYPIVTLGSGTLLERQVAGRFQVTKDA